MLNRLRSAAAFFVLFLAAATVHGQEPTASVSPIEAIARLEQLRDPNAPPSNQPCAAEFSLIERLAKGWALTDREIAEMILLASGDTDVAPLQVHLEQLDELTREARAAIDTCPSAAEKAERLLAFLHKRVLSQGYEARQSSLAVALNEGKFNGLSATALYHLVGQRLGLSLQVLEAPNLPFPHALAILVDGERRIPIETANLQGFNLRDKANPQPGVANLGQIDLAQARELDNLGLALAIYNSRALDLAKKGEHLDATILRFTMLALSPANQDLQKSADGALTRWIAALETAKKFDAAQAVGRLGLGIAQAKR